MPWHIGKSEDCPPSKPYAVIKDADGSVAGCHETEESAKAQLAALYASDTKAAWSSSYVTALPDSAFACPEERKYPHHDSSGKLDLPHLRNALSRVNQDATETCGKAHLQAHASAAGVGEEKAVEPIKAEPIGTAKYRILAIPFGGPLKGGKDLDHEYFSDNTDTKPHWFHERPVIFHHGKAELGDEDIGIEGDIEKKDDGWWAPLWLERQSRYFAMLDALIRAGKMFGSSGTMSHLVKKDYKTGEILTWPHVEQTLTLTPSNIYSTVSASKALDDFTSAGITVDDDMRPLFTEPDGASDLQPDLSSDGDGAAVARLVEQLDNLEALVKRLR